MQKDSEKGIDQTIRQLHLRQPELPAAIYNTKATPPIPEDHIIVCRPKS